MYRLLILLILSPFILLSKSQESCYTIQLISTTASQSELMEISKQTFPKSCKIMKISSTLTVRCGCYEKIKYAKANLHKYNQNYKHAYITTTYKHRFATDAPTLHQIQKNLPNTNELKLMLQSFLYVNDLKNAYKTAKIAYEQNPNSYYWNKKMAEISMWSGRSNESMKFFIFMNKYHYNNKLQTKIINHGLATYQYEEILPLIENKTRRDPSKKNIDEMIYIQSQAGVPARSALILSSIAKTHPKDSFIIFKMLEVHFEMGAMQAAQQDIQRLKKISSQLNAKEAVLVANFYYLHREFSKAYRTLQNADKENASAKFYEFLSDLGWYLRKYKSAANASLKLYDSNKTRAVDYERILYAQKDNNLTLASNISVNAYEKFKNAYIFYTFAFHALGLKEYDIIQATVNTFEKKGLSIINDAHFWLIKAELYKHYKQYKKEQDALQRALALSPNNLNIKLNILYMQLDNNQAKNLETLLNTLADNPSLNPSFYFPLASGYYNLQDINRAAYYLDLVKQENLSIQKSLAFKFLQANIYQAQNNPNAFNTSMKEIKKELKKSKKKNPSIVKSASYQRNYLNAIFDSSAPKKFEHKLKEAKAYLSKNEYNTFAYSWAIKNSALEKANSIYYKVDKHEIWMQLSHAIIEQNHSQIEDLIRDYINLRNWSDISAPAYADGQTALAQTMAYETLAHNDDSLGAYSQYLSLVQDRSELFDIKTSHYIHEPLKQEYVKITNRTYLNESWYLYSNFDFYKNESLNTNILLRVPDKSLHAGAGLKWIFQRGFAELDIHYHNSMKSYISYKLLAEYRTNHYFNTGVTLAKNIESDESTQLLLGGKKDMLAVKLTYNILSSTILDTHYEYNNYSSQDNVDLGSGNYILMNLGYQIRNGYPDMRIGAFVDGSMYSETKGSRGVIDEIQGSGIPVLPDNFYNMGLNFSYGMANANIYTREWRPFIEVSGFYNSFISDFSYGFNLGYGGKVFGQDHLVVGSSYSKSNNGIGDTIFELYLKYSILYTH